MQGQYSPNELNAAFWSDSWMLGLAFVFSFFTTMLMLASPLFLLLIYDRVLSARSQESLVALFALVVILLVLMALFDYSRRRILARFGARLQERLELRVLHAAEARAPRAALGTGPVSGTKELDRLRGFFHSSALIALLDFLWAPIFLGAVFLFHAMLGWVAVTGVLVLVAVSWLRTVFSAHLAGDADLASNAMNEVGRQIRDSQATIASQGMGRPIVERWRTARGNARDMSIVLADRTTWFTTIMKHLRLFFQVLILALGANLVLGGQLTIGGMVACFILLGRVFVPIEGFLGSLPTIRDARSNWHALAAILADAPAESRSLAEPGIGGAITASDLRLETRVSGPSGEGFNFSVAPGEVLQISGRIGSGKTQLARVLTGQLAPVAGSVALGGRNIERFGAGELSHLVGYLPEEIGFYPGTILQNIARMALDASEEEVVAAARRAGAHRMISSLPKGYRTWLDTQGSSLARGERQRIALARALYGQPEVLVLDDTAEIMPVNCGAFAARGPAVILLSRRPRSLMVPSRHCRLQGGTLIEEDAIPALPATDKRLAVGRAPKLVKG